MTIVLGAGLAGLASAYTLAKAGEDVLVIEKETYLGGRVRSMPIDGTMVDFGGFIIYPWYSEFHRIAKELDIDKKFQPIPHRLVYYELEKNKFFGEKELPFPITQKLRVYAHALGKLIGKPMDVASPPLDAFHEMSIDAFIQKATGKENTTFQTFSDIVCQGYCYGPTDQYKMGVVAQISYNTVIKGGLHRCVFLNGNNALFVDALTKEITRLGGTIQLGEEVITFRSKFVKTTKAVYQPDTIICAMRAQKDMLTDIAPHISLDCPYTHFYNAVFSCDRDPQFEKNPKWGALFCLPDKTLPLQILSYVNLHELVKKNIHKKFLNVNVIAREPVDYQRTSKELERSLLQDVQRIFSNVQTITMEEIVHWKEAMPIATESFIKAMRAIHGKDHIWFAGDYLGAPSMETALRTGVRAGIASMT